MKIRRSVLATAAALSIATLALVGCSSAAPGGAAATPGTSNGQSPDLVKFRAAASGSGKGLKLGYIALGDSIPFSKLVTKSMKTQAAKSGADLVVCDSAFDAAKALECVQNFKTQGVQGYLNFQLDSKAAAGICTAGPDVPVIAIDIEQKPCQTSFMGANNAAAGSLGGKAVGTYFKDKFDCKYDAFISLEQPAAGVVNDQRLGGYRDGFESVCGPIHDLRKVDGGGATDQARTVFADVLTTLPNASKIIVVAINDDSILGALAAARTAGREGDIYVSGQGADPSAHCEISKDPNWIGDVAYFPERYGEIGIPYLIDLVKGKDIPAKLLVPHKVVNADNIGDIYDLSSC